MKPYMEEIVQLLKSLLVKKKQIPEAQTAAVKCVGIIATAYPLGLQPYASGLNPTIQCIFNL